MIPMRSRAKRTAAIVADMALSIVAPLLVRRARRRGLSTCPSPRVLVIRCDHIGDAVMATAVLQPLREALRPAALDVLAGPWAAPIFEGHPAVDTVLTFATPWWSAARGATRREQLRQWTRLAGLIRRIRAARYDVAIDLRGDLRQIAFFLALGGARTRVSSDRTGGRRLLTHVWRHDPSLHEVEKNLAIVRTLVDLHGAKALELPPPAPHLDIFNQLGPYGIPPAGYAVLAPRASEPRRGWPAAHGAQLADAIHGELGLRCVLVGGRADMEVCAAIAESAASPVVNLAGRTSLSDLVTVLRGAAVTIAVDSGPMHLAAAVGSPVVALFGPTDPRMYRPWSPNSRVVSAVGPCGCAGPRCAYAEGPGRCMRGIDPSAVLATIREIRSNGAEKIGDGRAVDVVNTAPTI